MVKLLAEHLKKRADFLRAQKGIRRRATGLTLEICPTPEPAAQDGRYRIGFTASRKVGDAVRRNRAKRRLRAAAREILSQQALACTDYVLIARPDTLTRPFGDLLKDLAQSLAAAHLKLTAAGRGGAKEGNDVVG